MMATMMTMAASAQTMTIEQEREFYQKAYALFGVYSQSASVSDEEEEYTFRKLFANGDMQICNDLMSLSRKETLSVDEYITTLQTAKRVKVSVRNIKKDGPVEKGENGVWMLPVVFEKGMYFSKNGTLFDSYTYFGEYYRLRAVLAMDEASGECYIAALTADPKYKWLQFPEKFSVLERTSEDVNRRDFKRDNKLTINNRDVRWNLYGQVMLREGDVVKYNNSPVDLEVVDTSPISGTKMHAKYNDKLFRVRANMGYSIGGFNKLDGGSGISTPKDNEMSFGIDFGYVFPSTSKFYAGIFAGLGMSMNNLTMELGAQEATGALDINNCKADEDGESYTRHYSLLGNGVSQEMKATDITVPLYLDLEYQLTPMISIYADLGARLQTSSGKWTANVDGYEVWGGYSTNEYGNLEFKGGENGKDLNLNGFGTWKDSKSMEVDETKMTKSMSINILGGAGVRFNLSKEFAFDLGVQYLTGGNSWKNDGNDGEEKSIFNYTLPEGSLGPSVSPEEKAKGEKVNLLRQASGIKHSALRATASLILKF